MKLVANLPYSVASPILVELALNDLGPKRIVVTLQLEVARRLTARPGTPDYGVLTLLVQLDYLPIDWFKIPAGCFFPQPDVESACVILSRRTPPLLTGDLRPCFVSILKRSFSQRRKMMAKLLKEDWETSAVERALQETGLPSAVRAEMVSLEQFTKLTRILYERRNL